ncbi:MAG TPA: manganese efflux pump MntP family protein [Spirochaetota bacterium]|nr:manganese efflux pump MntP family protein [Spirochaetota bacterium]
MDYISVILIAIGLSMDAFAVSMSSGCIMKKLRVKMALRISLFFGFFQALMPIIGYLAGSGLKIYIEKFDHWVAFIILLIIGIKMLFEAFAIEKSETEDEKKPNYESLFILFSLAIATSIDALAVGITFSLLNANIFISAGIIGFITFMLSFIGVFFGCKFGNIFKKKVEILGALVLIGIGIKILIEHLFFA